MINSNLSHALFTLSFAVLSSNAFSGQALTKSQFGICAAAALEEHVDTNTNYSVDLSRLQNIDVSNALQPAFKVKTTLEMTLTNSAGDSLGDVICVLDGAGNVSSVLFEDHLSELALN